MIVSSLLDAELLEMILMLFSDEHSENAPSEILLIELGSSIVSTCEHLQKNSFGISLIESYSLIVFTVSWRKDDGLTLVPIVTSVKDEQLSKLFVAI